MSQQSTHEMLSWLNRNRQMLLDLYRNQYVAYNAKGMLTHGDNLQEVQQQANASGEEYLIYLVPRTSASIQILPIRFRT